MRCLVTGAAGFIGSHLCTRLLDDGHSVIGIDDLSTGRMENLRAAMTYQEFQFINQDITDDFCNLVNEVGNADWVFHLAAKADIVPSIQNPELYHRVNVTGTMMILEYARVWKAKRFVYAASSSCFGIPTAIPTGENARKTPMYPYALTKYLGEQYVMHWAQTYGVPAVSLRLFNVYGPGSRTSGAYGAVFGVFLSQMANGKPLTVVGNGRQARDFTFISDVVDAFVKAAQCNYSGRCYNIGTGEPQSVNRLVSLLGGEDGRPEVINLPDRPGEPRKTQAKTTQAEADLHWQPKVSFKAGVEIMRKLVNDYKDAPLWNKESIEVATKSWFQHLGGK